MAVVVFVVAVAAATVGTHTDRREHDLVGAVEERAG